MSPPETDTSRRDDTIDGVIARLQDVVQQAQSAGSRLGYFAVLYLRVTERVKAGIGSGRFDDGARMERLDVLFANRYLEALEQFQTGGTPRQSWQVAFDAAGSWRLLILQHLLLGINAHINLDLGLAAAKTAPGDALPSLKRDFNEINTILAELLDDVQERIGRLSPWLGLLDRVSGRTDEVIINFSLQRAREEAWKVAETMARLPAEQNEAEIGRLDERIARLGRSIKNPGWFLPIVLFIIRLAEEGDAKKVITALA